MTDCFLEASLGEWLFAAFRAWRVRLLVAADPGAVGGASALGLSAGEAPDVANAAGAHGATANDGRQIARSSADVVRLDVLGRDVFDVVSRESLPTYSGRHGPGDLFGGSEGGLH